MSADAPTDAPVTDDADLGEPGADEPGEDAPDATAARARGSRSVGPVVALGLAVVVVVAAVVVAVVGGDDVSATAVRVNATEVSRKTFNAQLRELAPVLRDQGAPTSEVTDAFVPSSTAAQLAQLYVYRELVSGRVDVTASDRRQLIDEGGQELQAFSPAVRALVVDVTLLQQKVIDERGTTGADRFARRLARDADVQVDPRYGIWNPALAQVCPPTGCAGAGASSGG